MQKEIVAEIEGYQKVIDGARAVLENYRPHIPIHPDWPMVEVGEISKPEYGLTASAADEGDSFPDATVVPSVTQFNLLTSLVDLGCNVVIIHGTSDPIVPYSNSQKMVDLVNHTLHPTVSTDINPKKYVQLLKVPGAGHMPHEENPQKFLEILKEIGYDFL